MRDMQKAPMDGSFIILFCPTDNISIPHQAVTARYSKMYKEFHWRTVDDYSVIHRFSEPVGWIPMPCIQTQN